MSMLHAQLASACEPCKMRGVVHDWQNGDAQLYNHDGVCRMCRTSRRRGVASNHGFSRRVISLSGTHDA